MRFPFHGRPLSRRLFTTAAMLTGFAGLRVTAETLPLDAKGSSLTFAGEALMHNFRGQAKEITGHATLDGNAVPPVQSATLQFNTAALTTFQADRDQNMKEWLQVKVYPEATFQLETVRLLQGDFRTATAAVPAKFAVSGTLTLHGVKQPLSGNALGWREKDRLIVAGETVIDTLKFGLPQIRQAVVLSVATNVKTTFRLSFVLPPEFAAK